MSLQILDFDIFQIVLLSGQALDLLGVIIILIGILYSTILYIREWYSRQTTHLSYTNYRRNLGKAILVGLEFLIAGDIIRTVAGTPTFTSVGTLAAIVLIRSFISINFEMELNGRWPWQKRS